MISKTKIDDSFPIKSIVIDGFSTAFRSACNVNGGGIMLHVREDILAKSFCYRKYTIIGLEALNQI